MNSLFANLDRSRLPVIICGAGRSGTTFAQVLISKLGIPVADEFYLYEERMNQAIESLFASLTDFASQEWRGINQHDWHGRLRVLFTQIVYCVSHSGVYDAEPVRFAVKTPGLMENSLEFLEEVFSDKPPLYVYCLRNGCDVVRSTVATQHAWDLSGALPMDTSVEVAAQYCSSWLRSISKMESFQEGNPERVLILQLDRCSKNEDRMRLVQSLNRFLGLPTVDEETIRAGLSEWAPVNPSKGKASERKLTVAQYKYLLDNKEFVATMDRYGYMMEGE